MPPLRGVTLDEVRFREVSVGELGKREVRFHNDILRRLVCVMWNLIIEGGVSELLVCQILGETSACEVGIRGVSTRDIEIISCGVREISICEIGVSESDT